MQQGPYNYDSYDAPPRGILEKIFGEGMAAKMRSPLFATVVFLLVAGIFAAVIAGSYSRAHKEDGPVPVVRADAGAYTAAPDAPGGMEVPYKDSAVFNAVRQGGASADVSGGIENLLAPSTNEETPVSKQDALAAAQVPSEPATPAATPIEASEAETPAIDQSALTPPQPAPAVNEQAAPAAPAPVAVKQETQKISPQELMKPQEQAKTEEGGETLEFVRSVLEQKDAQQAKTAAVPPAPATSIEPSAGAATPSAAAVGDYYVQVASVPSRDAAAAEWAKLQKFMDPLQGKSYRVQEASVSGKGTVYRIQAGPLSKDAAVSLCDSIKAQKPGGCLVVH